MALYILCAVFCSPCWPFLFCVRYFVRPFYLTQLYLFALLALSISCTVFCSPFLLNTPYLFALLALSVSCTVFYSPFLHYICSPWCYFAKEYNSTFALSGLHVSTLFSGATPVRSNRHLHLSFLARLERAIGLYSINNILCISYYSPCFVGLLHSSVSHLSLQLQQILHILQLHRLSSKVV